MAKFFVLPVLVFVIGTVSSYSSYSIPEPVFEAFSPKGLRVSIPDEAGIEYFEFHANLQRPIRYEDSGDLTSSTVTADHGHWIFWNPEVVIKPGDNINYWVTVRKDGVTYRRENGNYRFEKVTHIPDSTPPPLPDCDGDTHDHQVPEDIRGEWNNKLREMTMGRAETYGGAESRKSYESSYSATHQSAGSQPIVRSSSSTMQGTYLLKPTGIEGSGLETSSSYDSTKPREHQWQHYRKELSADELARHPHLKEFAGLHSLNKGEYGAYAAGFPVGNKEYHQSYYKKETTSNSNANRNLNLEQPAQYQHSYFQKTATLPQTQPKYYSSSYYKEESVHRNQQAPQAVPVRIPTYPITVETNKRDEKITEVNRADTLSLVRERQPLQPLQPLQPISIESKREERVTEVNRNVTPRPITVTYQQSSYAGRIFESSTQARTPSECQRPDYLRYGLTLEKAGQELTELRCLADLLEGTFKSELRALKHQNEELVRRVNALEHETQTLRSECECLGNQ